MFHQGKACIEEFFEYQSSYLACFLKECFITFVKKYFYLPVYKPVQVSIAKKTGFNMLKFFVGQLV